MAAIADQTEVGEAAVRTVEAGVDLLLCCHRPERQRRVIEALAAAVTEGRLTERRIDESIRRLETLFDAYVKPPESA
jgi:beta-N-acetylhexosaminidase